jgi:DNA modification methylase
MNNIIHADALTALQSMPTASVDCCITSPPYYALRDYGVEGQIGLEKTPEDYVQKLTAVFDEVYRVLKKSGTLWLIVGDSYNGSGKNSGQPSDSRWLQSTNSHSQAINLTTNVKGLKRKDLIGIPWMLAFAMRSAGWYLRQDIIWSKPNPMPESVTDRCTKAHEYIFLFSKAEKYFFDHEAIQKPAAYDGRTDTTMKGSKKYSQVGLNGGSVAARGRERWPTVKNGIPHRNCHSVWTVNSADFYDAHFATFPPKLIVDCIKAGCKEGGVVLDPFMGAGTTAVVARKLGRNFIGVELNIENVKMAERRLKNELGMFQ